MEIEQVIGERIASIRDINGVTQAELGQRLAETLGKPWPRQTVSMAEKGQRAFVATELVAIAHALETTVARLLTPPVNVEEVTMPSGVTISSKELRGSLVRHSAEDQFDSMARTLGILASALSGADEYLKPATEALQTLYDQLDIAHRITAEAERERRGEVGE